MSLEFTAEREITAPKDWKHMVIDTCNVQRDIVRDTVFDICEAGLEVVKRGDLIEVSLENRNLNNLGAVTVNFLEKGLIPSLLIDGFPAVEFYDGKGALIREYLSGARRVA